MDLNRVGAGSVALVGVPLDENSSFLRGPALAPARVREALFCGSSNLSTELGVDLDGDPRFVDAGDLTLTSGRAAIDEIDAGVAAVLDRGARVLAVGGDHSVTYPIVRATARHGAPPTLLHFDAHPDLYDAFDGNRFSHASPFARIMEEGLTARLVQVGIRTLSPPLRAQVARFGVEVVEMRDFRPDAELRIEGPVYVSLDLDALDPAFAPGVSHHEPGGLSTRDVLAVLHRVGAPIVGADVVEYNPTRDHAGMTAAVAAKFVKELAGLMLATGE
jgi:agmatinase